MAQRRNALVGDGEDGYFFANGALSLQLQGSVGGNRVTLRDELNGLTPRLRRYARALVTGSPMPSEAADDLVHATLMRALGARSAIGSGDLAVRLYATITQLHRERPAVGQSIAANGFGRPALVVGTGGLPAGGVPQSRLAAGLLSLPLEDREALLLVTLEGFEHGDAARILRISRSVLIARLTQARTALESALQAKPTAARRPTRDVPYLRLVT